MFYFGHIPGALLFTRFWVRVTSGYGIIKFDAGPNSVPNEKYGRQRLHAAASIPPYSLSTITPRIVT